jgi:hypothetical protein
MLAAPLPAHWMDDELTASHSPIDYSHASIQRPCPPTQEFKRSEKLLPLNLRGDALCLGTIGD